MATVEETIPEALRTDVDAAVAYFNDREAQTFEVTGIIDPATALTSSGARELRLVLCGGDRCEQRSFHVEGAGEGRQITLVDDEAPGSGTPQAELDPPPGARRGWLDRVLAEHSFVVLLFYRGFW